MTQDGKDPKGESTLEYIVSIVVSILASVGTTLLVMWLRGNL